MSDTTKTQSDFQIARPLSTYRREPAVEAVLLSWAALSTRVLLQKIAGDQAGEIPLEALVAAARAYVRAGADAEAWKVVEVIARRVAGRTFRHLAVWGLAGGSRHEDVTRDIVHMMMECVLSTDRRNEFWECRFWTCFDRRVRTILRDEMGRNPVTGSWDEEVERGADEVRVMSETVDTDWTDNIAARTLLSRLPEPLRTAFYLKHYAGYTEEGEEPTIASTLGVTGRTVRNYLRRASEFLAEWRGEGEGQ